MSKSISARLSDESQEALQYLKDRDININRMINRMIQRAAQEKGWEISLIPGTVSPALDTKAKTKIKTVIQDGTLSQPDGTNGTVSQKLQAINSMPKIEVQTAAPTPVIQAATVTQTAPRVIPVIQSEPAAPADANDTAQAVVVQSEAFDQVHSQQATSEASLVAAVAPNVRLQIQPLTEVPNIPYEELQRRLQAAKILENLVPENERIL